jgi:hypothetical protein
MPKDKKTKSDTEAAADPKPTEPTSYTVTMGPDYKGPTPVKINLPKGGARVLSKGAKNVFEAGKPVAACGKFVAELDANTARQLRKAGLSVTAS